MFLSDAKDAYNHFEPYIWYALAILAVPAIRRYSPPVERLSLAFVLAIFGTSDFYETIAWWTPWWLFLWKAGCLLIVAILSLRIWRRSGRVARPPAVTPLPPE